MANHDSSLKRIRQTERRRVRNRTIRQGMRTSVKTAKAALKGNAEVKPTDAKATIIAAISQIDKAASKGVIHPRAAARRVARLSKQAEKILLSK